jgi:cyclase
MLTKRIIPCLDVKANQVVKGVQFKNHRVVGDVIELAQHYVESGADELVFYDITASCEQRVVGREWLNKVARCVDIPFCVAGGIRSLADAEAVLNAGADKISINSPALENPDLIDKLVAVFGSQCVVVGIDSLQIENQYKVCQYTGDETRSLQTLRLTADWIKEVQSRGAGEIVLNCMNQDGMRQGYDVQQLITMRSITAVPLIASGGAGASVDFLTVFQQAKVDGALAASIFHDNIISIPALKTYLAEHSVRVRQSCLLS